MAEVNSETVNQTAENKSNVKENNFRMLEAKHQREIAFERQRIAELEKQVQQKAKSIPEDDDDEDEPYVVHKKLDKKFARFEEKSIQKTREDIENAVQIALEKERNKNWMESHQDFEEVMNDENVAKFIQKHKQLAQTINRMPQGFEREKLVYENMKELGINKPEKKEASIQDKIDANKRSPYYQPSAVGAAPYSNVGDFSLAGQKNAYAKVQDILSRFGK